MPLHSRPIPAPKTPLVVASNPTTYLARPEPPPEPRPTGRQVEANDRRAEPSRELDEPRAERAVADAGSQPWYRAEPWLAAMIAAFLPLVGVVLAPDSARYPLIGLSLLALLTGVIMLVRHGAFRPHPGLRE